MNTRYSGSPCRRHLTVTTGPCGYGSIDTARHPDQERMQANDSMLLSWGRDIRAWSQQAISIHPWQKQPTRANDWVPELPLGRALHGSDLPAATI